ncbi:radical SAM protein [Streptomyces sp. NPDC003717]|uniref:radical SAM protein n=1 Tax=Streptomyces sp. NPDC003717 TaxID=3154276 RepID=UPI0033B3CB02
MTMLSAWPTAAPFAGITLLELEITSPAGLPGDMTRGDWLAVITDSSALGIPRLRLFGGEPTVHPNWREFAELALALGMGVEVYSNLRTVREPWWELFTRDCVRLGTSYHSDDPEEHDEITGEPGSYVRTRCNIREAVRRGVVLRARIVASLPGQRVAGARAELESMGVKDITTPDGTYGRCTQGRARVLSNGDLAGCAPARDLPVGDVRTAPIGTLLGGSAWTGLSARTPPRPAGCHPDKDGSDCAPAETDACNPAY